MKRILISIAIVFALTSLAGAELLMPANTLGAGKMGWLAGARYDMNSQANSNLYGVGGFFGYGLTGEWDLYGKLGYGINSNPAAGTTGNAIAMAVLTKYQFIKESAAGSPVSVAGILGYEASTATMSTLGLNLPFPYGDIGAGAVISKIMVPWVPYGAAAYHSYTADTGSLPGGTKTTGSRIEVLVGTQLLLSKDSAIVGEFSYNSFSVGGTYTNNQISLAYAAKI